jgi:hypothetical protein
MQPRHKGQIRPSGLPKGACMPIPSSRRVNKKKLPHRTTHPLPCRRNSRAGPMAMYLGWRKKGRPNITNSLDAEEVGHIKDHVATCATCREYEDDQEARDFPDAADWGKQ